MRRFVSFLCRWNSAGFSTALYLAGEQLLTFRIIIFHFLLSIIGQPEQAKFESRRRNSLSDLRILLRAGECKNVSLIYECTFANTLLEIMDPWGKVILYPQYSSA